MENENIGLNIAPSLTKMIKVDFFKFLEVIGAHSGRDVVKNVACAFCAGLQTKLRDLCVFPHDPGISFIAVSHPVLFAFFLLSYIPVRARYRYIYFFYTRLRLSKSSQVFKLSSARPASRICQRRTYLFRLSEAFLPYQNQCPLELVKQTLLDTRVAFGHRIFRSALDWVASA